MRGGGGGEWNMGGRKEELGCLPGTAAFTAPSLQPAPQLPASVQIVVKIKVKQIILINI